MIIQKGLGYFDHSLLKGDIVKTSFGFWAVIKRVRETGDEDHAYSYSIILETFNRNNEMPNYIHRKDIIVAFESARLEDIRKDYPEYFI